MIQSNVELKNSLNIVNVLIQEIQDYIGPEDLPEFNHSDYKIRFPRNYLRSAAHFRSLLGFIGEATLKKNIAYCLIEADLLSWLLNRTDIVGTLREMIIKSGIIKMACIAESCIWHETKDTFGGTTKFKRRCSHLRESDIISEKLNDDLNWLWSTRDSIHLFLIGEAEYQKYKDSDYDRAFLAVRSLIQIFNEPG